MAITFPRSLPAIVKGVTSRFELVFPGSTVRSAGGAVFSTGLADAYWKFSVTTPPLPEADAAELQAWWESMSGGQKSFLAHDLRNPEPLAYPNGVTSMVRGTTGGAFDGTAIVAAFPSTRITVGGAGGYLPASFQFKAGDKIGLVSAHSTPRRFTYRVVESVNANAAGVAQVEVWPPVKQNIFAVGNIAVVSKPVCEFVPERESWSYAPELVASPVTFSGISRLY